MSHFAPMMAEIFRRRGTTMVYAAPSDPDLIACKAIRQGGGTPIMLGPVKVIVDRTFFHVRRAEVASPVIGGTLAISEDTFTVEAIQPVENDVDQLIWQLEAAWGVLVAYRSVTGTGASQSPPQAIAPKVDALTLAGVSAITIGSASLLVGKLAGGDTFTIAGNATIYTVTGPVTAAANKLTAVPFTPVLAANAAAGAAVTFVFARDYSVRAAVAGYTADDFAGGILTGDRRLVIMEAALDDAGMADHPKALDRVTMEGRTFVVQAATAIYQGSVPIAWDLQIRG